MIGSAVRTGPYGIMESVIGLVFPATKEDVLRSAEKNSFFTTVGAMEVLARISEKKYFSPAQIMREISRVR